MVEVQDRFTAAKPVILLCRQCASDMIRIGGRLRCGNCGMWADAEYHGRDVSQPIPPPPPPVPAAQLQEFADEVAAHHSPKKKK